MKEVTRKYIANKLTLMGFWNNPKWYFLELKQKYRGKK